MVGIRAWPALRLPGQRLICGGGFTARPVRPRRRWKGGNGVGADPARSERLRRPADLLAHAEFAAMLALIPSEQR